MVEELTRELVEWIRVLPPPGIYTVFFLVAYFENIIPPIPGDVLVAFGGYLAAESVIGLLPVFLLTTVASVLGFMSVYALGSHWGEQVRTRKREFWMVRFISLQYIEKARQWMQRWGQGVIVANRFLSGTRSVISLAAGISHTPVPATVASSALSSLLWNAILLGFGWFVHSNWAVIGQYLSAYGQIVLGILVLVVAVRVGIYYYRRERAVREEADRPKND